MAKLDICNKALQLCNERIVQDLNDGTKASNTCNLYYDDARKSLLREHAWNFATGLVSLADVGSPPSKWAFRYQYPSNALKAVAITKDFMTDPDVPFEVISDGTSKYIVTNKVAAELKYVFDIEDTLDFDPKFEE